MLHRTILGSMERFLGILIEHYAGRFPDVARAGAGRRSSRSPTVTSSTPRTSPSGYVTAGVRVEVVTTERADARQDRQGPGEQKVPYMLVVGDKEIETDTVGVRERDRGRHRCDGRGGVRREGGCREAIAPRAGCGRDLRERRVAGILPALTEYRLQAGPRRAGEIGPHPPAPRMTAAVWSTRSREDSWCSTAPRVVVRSDAPVGRRAHGSFCLLTDRG